MPFLACTCFIKAMSGPRCWRGKRWTWHRAEQCRWTESCGLFHGESWDKSASPSSVCFICSFWLSLLPRFYFTWGCPPVFVLWNFQSCCSLPRWPGVTWVQSSCETPLKVTFRKDCPSVQTGWLGIPSQHGRCVPVLQRPSGLQDEKVTCGETSSHPILKSSVSKRSLCLIGVPTQDIYLLLKKKKYLCVSFNSQRAESSPAWRDDVEWGPVWATSFFMVTTQRTVCSFVRADYLLARTEFQSFQFVSSSDEEFKVETQAGVTYSGFSCLFASGEMHLFKAQV